MAQEEVQGSNQVVLAPHFPAAGAELQSSLFRVQRTEEMKVLLLLLLAVGTAAAPHVNFLHFSQNGKPSGVQSAIGYAPIEVLEYAWSKYGSRLIRAV